MRYAAAFIVVATASCAPTNPFDPATPSQLQAKGALTGKVVLQDPTAPADTLASETAVITVALLDESGRPLEKDGAKRTVTLTDGKFTFDALLPGVYTPVVDNVGTRFTRPSIPSLRVLAGATSDVGELDFVFTPADGGGPGRIHGEVALVDADGGARSVAIFRLSNGGAPALVASALTDASGAFDFTALSVGTYAVVGQLAGFTPDYKVDVKLDDAGGGSLDQTFLDTDALHLHPVTAVLRANLPIVEGQQYTSADTVPLDVLAFGGVTSMRLANDSSFLDDSGAALAFTPYTASVQMPLPAVEGPVSIFGQFQIESPGGFVFTSDVFSTSVIRDVTPPDIVSAAFPGLALDGNGRALANIATGASPTLRVTMQDAVSAVAGLAVVVQTSATPPAAPQSFDNITAVAGLISRDEVTGLDPDGDKHVFVFARDRAGNVGGPVDVDVLLDRTAPNVPLTVPDAVAGVLPVRATQLVFNEAAAVGDLPVAMQIGVAPVAANAPIVPYATSTSFVVDPAAHANGTGVTFEARLFDAAGNSAVIDSTALTLTLRARLQGTVALEGVPEIETPAPTAVVTVLDAAGASVASTTTNAGGSFLAVNVPESAGGGSFAIGGGASDSVSLAAPGYAAVIVPIGAVDGQRAGDPAVDVGAITLALARGTVQGRFRLADFSGDDQQNAGIAVTATLSGSTRTFSAATITSPAGDYAFNALPATRAGERYVVDARFPQYGAASSEVTLAGGTVAVIDPDVDGKPTAVLLPRNVGDFDVCAASGPCNPVPFVNTATARVKLRDTANVTQIRVQARTPFLEGDAAPAFIAFNAQNATSVDISGADGLVQVFVQVKKSDGTESSVLSTTVTLDTVAPTLTELRRIAASGAVDQRFSKDEFLDIVVFGDPGTGNVAPLATARAVVADVPPASPPGNATPCGNAATCRVLLPGADVHNVVEKLHTVFAFACDAAGNCSAPSSTFVIHDVTPPAASDGVAFTVLGAGGAPATFAAGSFVLPSPLYSLSLDVGAAKTAAAAPVLDETGAAVPDVLAYRFSFTESTSDAFIRALDPAPVASDTRSDLIVPALPATDGTYTVFAELVDAAGNTTLVAPNPFHQSLRLDTTPPVVTFALTGVGAGAAAGISTSSVITFNVGVPVGGETPNHIDVAADGGLFASGVLTKSFPLNPAGEPFTLPNNGDGTYTVFAHVFDDAGNRADRSATIVLDTQAPSVLSASCRTCTVNNGTLFTNNDLGVVLDVAASDVTTRVTNLDTSLNGGATVRAAFNGSYTQTLALNVSNTVVIKAVDAAGLVTAAAGAATLTIIHDHTAPTLAAGAVVLDGGALHTNNPVVSVATTAVDTNGVVGMRLSTTAAFSGPVLAFVSPTSFTLTGADAPNKQVCVEVRDGAGNIASQCTTIDLDRTAPVGTVSLAGGAATVTSPANVAVALAYDAGTVGFAVSTSALDCSSASYSVAAGVSTNTTINLAGADGQKTVFACFKDAAGNTSAASDDVLLDTQAPSVSAVTCRTCTVSGGQLFTNDDTGVVVDVIASDATTAVASLDVSLNGAAAVRSAFTGSFNIALPLNQASTINVKAVDSAGLVTSAANSLTITVVHDHVAPTLAAGAVVIDAGALHTNNVVATVTTAAVDTNSVTGMRLSATPAFAGVVLPFTSPATFTFTGSDSPAKQVCVEVRDPVGNIASQCATIDLDRTAPVGSVSIASGAAVTKQTAAVPVALTFDLGTTGFAVSASALTCATATYTSTGGTTANSTVNLVAGDGTKTVFACFQDAAGNTSSASDDIVLDQTAPAATIAISNGAAFVTSINSVTVNIAGADATLMNVQEGARTLATCQALAIGSYEAIATTKTINFAAGADGVRTVSTCFQDAAGNVSVASDTITLDTTKPTATVTLTGTTIGTVGANPRGTINSTSLTRTPFISVTLGALSADATDLEISNDPGFAGEVFEPIVPGALPHQLLATDGSQTVFVLLRDAAGNTSNTLQASITLDTAPPSSPTILVDGGNAFTNNASGRVTLTVNASASPTEMAFSTTGDFSSPTFQAFAASVPGFSLGGSDGLKTVFAIFRDAAGNETAAVNDGITLDRTAPSPVADVPCPAGTNTVICVNSGAAFSNSVSVTLTLSTSVVPPFTADADKATEMQIAVDGTADTEPFIPYSQNVVTLLAAGDCTAGNPACKTVAVRFRDAAGNLSAQFSDTIGLDTTAPTAPRIQNSPEVTHGVSESVALSISASDTFGFTYQLIGAQFADWTNTAHTGIAGDNFVFNLTNPSSGSAETGDVFNLGVRAVDPAGNISGEQFVTMTCDGNAPSTPTGLKVAERSGSVSLKWSRPPGSEADVVGYNVRYGNDPSNLTDTFAAEGPSPIFVPLPSGSGTPSITLTGLTDNTPFTFTVSAVDHATAPNGLGNESGQTTAQTVVPNIVAPTVIGGLARHAGGTSRVWARNGRVYAMDGTNGVCAYDVSDPTTPTQIACKTDPLINNTLDSLSVFGRFAYLHRNGDAGMRVFDIGKLAGSSRGNAAAVTVTTLGATTSGAVDMMFMGNNVNLAGGYATIAREAGSPALSQLSHTGSTFSGQLAQAATNGTFGGATSTPIAADATLEISGIVTRNAAGTQEEMTLYATTHLATMARLDGITNEHVEDIHFDTGSENDSTHTARLMLAGTFGIEFIDVGETFDGVGVPNGIPLHTSAVLGGFECNHIESVGGYVYCNDIASGTANSLLVIALAPSPHVVGRLLVTNTHAPAGGSGTTIAGFTVSENMVYAVLNDATSTLVAIELVDPQRFITGGSLGTKFDDVVVDGSTLYATDILNGSDEAFTFDISDPAAPTQLFGSQGQIVGGCDTTAARHTRTSMFGRAPVSSCYVTAGPDLVGALNVFNSRTINSAARARAAADTFHSRSMVVDGNIAYILANSGTNGRVEAWELGRAGSPDAVDATLVLAGAHSFSRLPAIQDDRLVFVDDAGTVFSVSTTNPAAMVLTTSTAVAGTADTSNFGDVKLRGGTMFVTSGQLSAASTGFVLIPIDQQTGAIGVSTSKLHGFGAIATAGTRLLVSDGTLLNLGVPAVPTGGEVSGVFSMDRTGTVKATSQTVLAPFSMFIAGATFASVNHDSGLETLTLSR